MQQSDFQRFHAVMTGMAKVYEREIDDVLLDAYWLALRSWSLADFEQAAAHLMATETFMPRPAHFTALRRARGSTAGEAWAVVLQHLKRGYRTSGLSPEIDRAVAALGGYRALAMMPVDQLPWQAKRFAEAFAEVQDTKDARTALPTLNQQQRARTLHAPRAADAVATQASPPGSASPARSYCVTRNDNSEVTP